MCNTKRLQEEMFNADYVIYATALKHVFVAEYNPMACIKTNIDGVDQAKHGDACRRPYRKNSKGGL